MHLKFKLSENYDVMCVAVLPFLSERAETINNYCPSHDVHVLGIFQ